MVDLDGVHKSPQQILYFCPSRQSELFGPAQPRAVPRVGPETADGANDQGPHRPYHPPIRGHVYGGGRLFIRLPSTVATSQSAFGVDPASETRPRCTIA